MYIIKNAFRCIGRAKGRNILIGIIALACSLAACIRPMAFESVEAKTAENRGFSRSSFLPNSTPA